MLASGRSARYMSVGSGRLRSGDVVHGAECRPLVSRSPGDRVDEDYLTAPKTSIDLSDNGVTPKGAAPPVQFLEVDINEAICAPSPTVTFHYRAQPPGGDFTRTVRVLRQTRAIGLTRIFAPVFENFDGLTVSDGASGCFGGAHRVTNLIGMPLLLGATLPPDWESLPLYQRLQ